MQAARLPSPLGWSLAPAYDMNPNPHGAGLKLNFSETDNTQDLDLAREVAPYFRVEDSRANETMDHLVGVVADWRDVAIVHQHRSLSPSRYTGVQDVPSGMLRVAARMDVLL